MKNKDVERLNRDFLRCPGGSEDEMRRGFGAVWVAFLLLGCIDTVIGPDKAMILENHAGGIDCDLDMKGNSYPKTKNGPRQKL